MDKYIGRLLDGRYEILEEIGRGGMAVVYRARCHRLNRYVAVKLHIVGEQQAESCCSSHFLTGYFGYGKSPMQLQPFVPFASSAA